MRKSAFLPSQHAITRYIERFEGNITPSAASRRLTQLVQKARFERILPGQARLYCRQHMRFVVAGEMIVTVYRLAEPDQRREQTRPDEDWKSTASA